MSAPGGGRIEIEELVRSHGADALRAELAALGQVPDAQKRVQCVFPGCTHKGPKRDRDAQFFSSGKPHVFCFACNERGDLLDLMQLRGMSKQDALEQLRGAELPKPSPQLRVVPPAAPTEDPDKLKPAQVKKLWDAMEARDELGEEYLRGRGLEDAVDLGVVRFLTEKHPDEKLKRRLKSGYRVAALLADVVGNPRGIQTRTVLKLPSGKPKILSITGSTTSTAFFGQPDAVEHEPIIAVAEGLADTLAVSCWVGGAPGVAVVGAAGKDFLPKLAEEIQAAGIPVADKYFVLFPQNDEPVNQSRREFRRLGQLLHQLGAHVVWVAIPKIHGDVAEWREAQPDVAWPPSELQKAILPEPGDDMPRADEPILPDGCAVPVPKQVKTEHYRQDFTTLCSLLDDPGSRGAIMGPGEFTWCEMTWFARVGGRRIEEVDLSSIRLGLEAQGRSTDGKPLKFKKMEIAEAVSVLARRRTVHPVRDWLRSLQWDAHQRIETELPLLFGHESGGFEATLLKRWMVSAVARAMVPGTKVDTVLVLVGEQGARKSSFFDVMGGEWFTDAPVQIGDTTGMMIMREKWIVEWAELEAMRRARDQESIKAFLSARVDFFRAPYLAKPSEAKRHCVIVGTTNNEEFLHDPTGSRRFWPIRVRHRIDIEWVRSVRDQLWAEAVNLYMGGEQHYLTAEEEAQLYVRNADHQAQDIWLEPIQAYLREHLFAEVSAAQVLSECFKKDMDTWTDADARRVVKVLKALGWLEAGRESYAGRNRRVYARP